MYNETQAKRGEVNFAHAIGVYYWVMFDNVALLATLQRWLFLSRLRLFVNSCFSPFLFPHSK